jgi:hypothetical protein
MRNKVDRRIEKKIRPARMKAICSKICISSVEFAKDIIE